MPIPSNILVKVPVTWSGVSDRQLSYLCSLLAGGYEEQEMRLRFFLYCSSLTAAKPPRHAGPSDHYFYHFSLNKPLRITAEELSQHLELFNFIHTAPQFPRLPIIENKKPTSPTLTELSFGSFLSIQNYYVAYMLYKSSTSLTSCARILWNFEEEEKDPSPDVEPIYHTAVHLYFLGLSSWLSRAFPELYRNEGEEKEISIEQQHAQVNSMIRALTGGDITREKEVLSANAFRALTELNEKAREARELKKHSK